MKPFQVALIVTILLVNVFSHAYNELNSSHEQSIYMFNENTVFESSNNSSGNTSNGGGNSSGNNTGNNTGGGTNSTISDAHCLILSNFTINQTNYVSVHLVNTCNASINYPGINASSDHSGVSGLYDTWWYVIGGGNGSGNQSSSYPYYQMGWQLSFNQSIVNGTLINLTFQATVLNCGPNNSWSNACPNSNNSIIRYQLQYITPIARLSITSATINTDNDRISLRYFSENYSGYVSWVYTTANGTSTITSYTNSVNRTTYIYPDIFGVIQICGTIPGDTTCTNITRSIRLLNGGILYPEDNFTTNNRGVYVSYFAGNYAWGSLEINNNSFHFFSPATAPNNDTNSSIFVNLPFNWSTVCLRLSGDNNTLLVDCVNIYRTLPVIRFVINSVNMSEDNRAIEVSYTTENYTGGIIWEYTDYNGTLSSRSFSSSGIMSIYPNVFGAIEVCGSTTGPFGRLDDSSITVCSVVNRTPSALEGNLISPNNNTQFSSSDVSVDFFGENYTNGSISVNGLSYRTFEEQIRNNNTSYVSVLVNLDYGSSTICLELWGDNGSYLSDCVVVHRNVPQHTVLITSPQDGSTFIGQHIDVQYFLTNSSGHYFTLDGAIMQTETNTTGSSVRLEPGYGGALLCLVSIDFAGNAEDDCIQVNLLNPYADNDADGVSDVSDLCPNTDLGLAVDSGGCATNQLDTDADGVNDAADICPHTIVGSQVNAVGCSSSQRDSDSDGIVDSFDQCPNTVLGTVVDQTGCDFNNSNGGSSSGGSSNGNSSSLPEDPGLPGFEASLAIAAVCVAFMSGTRNRESEN